MINPSDGWIRCCRGTCAVLLLVGCALQSWSQSSATPTRQQPKILGFDPGIAEIGQPVRMRVSSTPSNGYSLLVAGIPVKATIENDPQWLTFTVPNSVPPGEEVKILLFDGDQPAVSSLVIRPLEIVQVSPTVATRGEQIVLTIHPAGVSLGDAKLLFNSVNSSVAATTAAAPSSPLQVVAQDKLNAIVPEDIPTGAVSLQIVSKNGGQSSPYNQFRVGWLTRTILWVGGILAATIYGVAVFLFWRFRRTRLARRSEEISPGPVQGATINLPPLEVPTVLVDACLRGTCVLYAGAGLSARAGLPTWTAFVEDLLKWAEIEQLIDKSFSLSLHQRLESGGFDRVADSVVNAAIEHGASERLYKYLNEIFGTTSTLSDAHRILSDIKFSAALTTNFDGLIEQAFNTRNHTASVYVPSETENLRSALSNRQFFVLKLYGSFAHPDSLLVSPAQYLDRIRSDRPFNDFVQQLFHSRTILFLGASFAGIEAYLSPLKLPPSGQIRHYAIVAVNDASWQADAYSLEKRYGIRVLPYVASARHGEVLTFVRELRDKIADSKPDSSAGDAAQDDEQAAVVLTNLELYNVGPFERLEISFTRRWTVLLGDNGVGKSSVLRAIAAVAAGDQATQAGARLLRSGQNEGYIRLTTRNDTYSSRLSLNSLKRSEIVPEGASGLGGSLLVLAFPAIRTMTSGPTSSPELRDLAQAPSALDVLPGLVAMPDPRILGFKQWLTNLDYAKSKGPQLARRVDAVMSALSGALGILLGGMQVSHFEVQEKDVLVQTDDGRLSVDALSQGTISVLGWIGVLVQRLHEVSEIPNGRALVLLDEIDAHMHPEWQQAIVSRLVEAFPLVQFIVSTHSPFLAVGRRADEIIRFRRDPVTKKVVAERADQDTTDMTVADVLTSYLFGLQTAVGHDLQKDVLKMRELSLKQELTSEELEDLQQLGTKLDKVGVADTQADPLYGKFLEELTKQKAANIANLPPLSKKAEERQRELTKQIAQKVLRDERSIQEKNIR